MTLQVDYRPKSFKTFVGNADVLHSIDSVLSRPNPPSAFLITGPSGCVDCDTEFLSPSGWKKISDYNNELVLQWDMNSLTASFVKPFEYVKLKCEILTYFQTKYGVDQCLSNDHRFLYYLPKKDKFYVKPFIAVKKQHAETKFGFSGKIPTAFENGITGTNGIALSEDELRIQVMINADGSFTKGRTKVCVNIKKQRKIKRAELLLKKAKIEYDKYIMGNGYVRFYFVPPIKEKRYTFLYYMCSQAQLNIISDEVLHWDGDQKQCFYTSIKTDADFIQYAFTSTGKRASIYTTKRNANEFKVQFINNPYVGLSSNKKIKMLDYKTKDGYKYCFVVPSSFLVLRRNNKIFITGNCGKTTLGRIIKNILKCSDVDYKELNSSDERKLVDMRRLIESMRYAPLSGSKKVYLLDEAHKIMPDAQEALLKALEEPPKYVHWIICTTNPEVFKPTFKRRCHCYELAPLTFNEISKLIRYILKKEGKENFSNDIKDLIIDMSEGSAGQALKLLDMVIDMDDVDRALNTIKSAGFGPGGEDVNNIVKILTNGKTPPKTKWSMISKILKEYKGDGESIRRPILAYLSAILLNNGSENAFYMMEPFKKNFYDSGRAGLISACYEAVFGEE